MQNKRHILINGTTEIASVQLVLKFVVTCLWVAVSCHRQRPVHSLTLF